MRLHTLLRIVAFIVVDWCRTFPMCISRVEHMGSSCQCATFLVAREQRKVHKEHLIWQNCFTRIPGFSFHLCFVFLNLFLRSSKIFSLDSICFNLWAAVLIRLLQQNSKNAVFYQALP
jgi:hypothetical protein